MQRASSQADRKQISSELKPVPAARSRSVLLRQAAISEQVTQRVLRISRLLIKPGEIEVGVGERGILRQGFTISDGRLVIALEILEQHSEIERQQCLRAVDAAVDLLRL